MREAFERLRSEMKHAFAAPESSYQVLNAAEVITNNRSRPGRARACDAPASDPETTQQRKAGKSSFSLHLEQTSSGHVVARRES